MEVPPVARMAQFRGLRLHLSLALGGVRSREWLGFAGGEDQTVEWELFLGQTVCWLNTSNRTTEHHIYNRRDFTDQAGKVCTVYDQPLKFILARPQIFLSVRPPSGRESTRKSKRRRQTVSYQDEAWRAGTSGAEVASSLPAICPRDRRFLAGLTPAAQPIRSRRPARGTRWR